MTRPRKPYRPKPVRNPFAMRIKVNMVFEPIEHALGELLRTGTVDADGSGAPIFRNHIDGDDYNLAAAMAGVVTMFEMWGTRHRKTAPVWSLNVLCGRMGKGEELTEALVRSALESLPALRAIALQMGEEEAADLVRGTQIRIQLELQNELEPA